MANFKDNLKPLKKTESKKEKKYKYRIGKPERRTFLIQAENSDKLERLAYSKGMSMNEVLNKILDLYFKDKDFDPIPKETEIEGF